MQALAEPYDGFPAGTPFEIIAERWPVLRPELAPTSVIVLVGGERREWNAPGPSAIETEEEQ